MTTTLDIASASAAIAAHVTQRLETLRQEESAAYAAYDRDIRAQLRDVPADASEEYRLVCLAAAGAARTRRSDGLPQVVFDDDLRALIERAAHAEVIPHDDRGYYALGTLTLYSDLSGLATRRPESMQAAYAAWDARTKYERANAT